MSSPVFTGDERRDTALALGAALIYLASAVIDPILSLVIFFLFLGTAVALMAREHFKEPESATARGH